MLPILLVLAHPALAQDAEPAAAPASHLTGRYELAVSASELQATLDAAVEKAAAEFNPLIRGFARSRLQRATNMCQRYEIRVSGDRWTHRCDDDPPLDRVIDATVVSWKPDEGDPVDTTLSVQGDVARVVLKGESGTRTNLFRSDAGGLDLEIVIESDALDQPMRWTTRYRRVP